MIGDQAKIPCGPSMLDRPAPWEVCIRPLRIVAKDQLLRSLRNRVFAWEPGQIGEDQLPTRFQPRFDQGHHTLGVEIEPTLSTTDDIEGLWRELRVFSSTGCKADVEVFLDSQLLGSHNLC